MRKLTRLNQFIDRLPKLPIYSLLLTIVMLFAFTNLHSQTTEKLGDFIWYDSNNDGIQDPGEPQLNGVIVELYAELVPGTYTLVGITTSNASGEYAFNATNSFIQDNTNYYLVIQNPINEPGSFNPTGPTVQDAGPISVVQDDLDSDASIAAGGFPFDGQIYIEYFVTGGFADICNLDFGVYTLCADMEVILLPVDEICEGEVLRLEPIVNGATGDVGFDWSDGGSTTDPFYDISPSELTRYVVTVTDEIGCTSTAELDVPVRRCPLDMALIKTISPTTTFGFGDLVTFDIQACNQGESIVDSLEITDHIPAGYSLVDPNWVVTSSTSTFVNATQTLTINNGLLPAGGLLPGGCIDITIDLQIEPTASKDDLVNFAEITAQRDIFGFEDDSDSTPGSNSPEELSVTVGSESDDNLDSAGPLVGDDEDDHDPAQAPFFDLALFKSTAATGPFKYGDPILYEVTLCNQGNMSASDIVIIDYVPSGLEFDASNAPLWSYDAASGIATANISGNLSSCDCMVLPLTLNAQKSTDPDGWLNYAEIYSAEDTFGIDRTLEDVDSTPDDIIGNDIGGTANTAEDDHIDDDGMDTNGDGITDEDDHDPELIGIFDLSLKKEITTLAPFVYGQDIIFEIEVCNQGNIVADNIEITDYIPAGYDYNPAANGFLGWTGTPPNITNTDTGQLAPGACRTETLVLIFQNSTGANDWFNYAEITGATDNAGVDMTGNDADSTPGSNTAWETDVIPGSPFDDEIYGCGQVVDEDEDDHDPAGIFFYDLALTKTTTATGPFRYGDIITFEIEVFNQADLPANNVEIIDYIPSGFSFVSSNFPTWVENTVTGEATTVINNIAPATSEIVTIDLEFVNSSTNSVDAWTNYAEILSFQDADGIDVSNQDVDSTPNGINGDDAGGTPDSNEDDHIDDDGMDTNGDGITDEDDHDPERVEIFDLALIKELNDLPPYSYGQMLSYTITVENQGNVTANNIEITDYLPAGLGFDTANNPGWTPAGTYTITNPMLPDDVVMIPLNLTFLQTNGGQDDWLNYTEITEAFDVDGGPRTNDDADSTPASNGADELSVLPGDPDDNNLDGGGPRFDEDEDDHDPAGFYFYDLALNKVNTTAGPYNYGDRLTYDITVFNQGNLTATDITIVDYIPSGLMYVGSNGPTWSYDAVSGVATTTINNLMPGVSQVISIELEVVETTDIVDGWTNYSEIFSFEDENGVDVSNQDIDSTPDDNIGNDIGGTPDSDEDDHVDDDGNDTNMDGITDEDDHDPERIDIYDLALVKRLLDTPPYSYGQVLDFEIEVCNQGNEIVQNVEVSDYLPVGFTFDMAVNPGWTAAATYTIVTPLNPGQCTTIPLSLTIAQTTGGEKDWINYAEITGFQDEDGMDQSGSDADSTPGSDSAYENEVLPGDDFDDVFDGNGQAFDEDEDDHDPAGIQIVDLALRKTESTSGPYEYGDQVCFNIDVFNQGSVTVMDAGIIDYSAPGFTLLGSNFPLWANGVDPGTATLSIKSIEPGQTVSNEICYEITKSDAGITAWDNCAEINYMEDENWNDLEDIDSTHDNINGNDAGATIYTDEDNHIFDDGSDTDGDGILDEDDHDCERIEIYDMALNKKLLTAGPHNYGDVLDFQIEIFNQGNVPIQNVEVTDYLPVGYGFDLASNPGWAAGPIYTHAGSIAPGASEIIDLSLTILQTTGGDEDWINYAEITGYTDVNGVDQSVNDADSTPGSNTVAENAVQPGDEDDDEVNECGPNANEDEDDHDPAGIEIVDLALRKTENTVGPYEYGDQVCFNIDVFNQGSVTVNNAGIIDYATPGFTLLGSNFPLWSNGVDPGTATLSISSIEPGQMVSTEICYEITKSNAGITAWDNCAEINYMEDESGAQVGDFDSTPDNISNNDIGATIYTDEDNHIIDDGNDTDGDGILDEDDHDCERIEVYDMALNKKLLTAGPYSYGDVLDFQIEIFNQGNVPIQNVEITDYLPVGYGFDLASNPGWAAGPVYTHLGAIPPGGSELIDLSLTILQTSGGDEDWINYAEITGFTDTNGVDQSANDADSTPGSNTVAENAVQPGDEDDDEVNECGPNANEDEDDHDPAGIELFDLALRKELVSTGPFNFGDIITFNVTVFNQGSNPVTNVEVVDYIPSGLTYVGSNFPTWTYNPSSNEAITTIANLAPGQSMTIPIDLSFVLTADEINGWTNYAEIASFQDSNFFDVSDQDVDSTPDDINGNDVGGTPDSPEDDHIDDDSMDTNGDGITDEDDHDPERIEIFDLALRKTVVTPEPYMYGQLIEFQIEVFNQGNTTVDEVLLNDYVPIGYSFNAGSNAGWSGSTPLLNYTVSTPIAPGDSAIVPLFLTLEQTTGGERDWINYAEIAAFQDINGNDRSTEDSDSTPNTNTSVELDVEPGDPDDDNIEGDALNLGEDEDDHDPAGIKVIDLALRKTTSQTGPFTLGDQITFDIEVFNQGNMNIDEVGVIDYIPEGMQFTFINFPHWFSDPLGDAAITSMKDLAPGESRTVSLTLQILKSFDGALSWDNCAEVYYMEDSEWVDLTDIDSNIDIDPNNDIGGSVNTPEDDLITDDGTDRDGDGVTDEDDHDCEQIEIFDLALQKTIVTPEPYDYCELITFNIRVHNQGNEPATLVNIVDYLPIGYSFDPALNTGWTGTAPNLVYQVPGTIMPDTFIDIPLVVRIENTQGGYTDWDNYAEVLSAANRDGVDRTNWDFDSTPGSNATHELSVTPGDDDDNNIEGCGPNSDEDEDDHDPAGIDIFDLALRKEIVEQGPYDYFDTVTFTITVFNQGNMDARNIEIIDYLPVGLEMVPDNYPTWDYDFFDREATTMIMGPLAPGESQTVEIMLEIQKLKNDEDAWDNRAEIYGAKDINFIPLSDFDSDMDSYLGNDIGGTPWTGEDDFIDDNRTGCNTQNEPNCGQFGVIDEDDEDVARPEIFDLALRKTLDTPPVHVYNQIVDFSVWVFNQGNEEANFIQITDYLPPGYDFDPAINPGWTQLASGDLQYTTSNPLAAVDSIQIPLKLEIIRTDGGYKYWTNYAEITEAFGRTCENFPPRNDWDVDSTPGSDSAWERNVCLPPYNSPDDLAFPWDDEICGCGPEYDEDEDDHDPAGIEIFDLAQIKTTTFTPPYRYGNVVTFDLDIYNQGSLEAYQIELRDYIPCGFEFDPNLNPGWTLVGNEATTIIDQLIPGESTRRSINLIVIPCIPQSEIAWTNYTELSSAETEPLFEPLDFDSTIDALNNDIRIIDNMTQNPNDEDDHDCEKLDVLDIALKKTTPDCGPFSLGDTVDFVVHVYNQGNIDAANVIVNDSVNTGFIFDPSLNPGWGLSGNIATYAIPGTIAPMDSVIIPLQFVVTIDGNPHKSDWWNRAEILQANNVGGSIIIDADSNPDGIFTNDNFVVPNDSIAGVFDPNDDEITENHPVYGLGDDEDDSDPAKVNIFGGLGDFVWKDLDGDGIQDPSEPGVEGVWVRLYDCDGNLIQTTETDNTGFYFFNDIYPGDYQVVWDISDLDLGCAFTLQNQGFDTTLDSDSNNQGMSPCINIEGGEYDSTFDAGLLVLAAIGDFVWEDMNGDGIQQFNEPGIENVRVNLYDPTGNLVTTTITDANGKYLFDLLYPGEYYLEFVADPMWILTVDNQGTSNALDSDVDGSNGLNTTPITVLVSGEVDLTWDAGFYKCVPIGELVWYDINENNVWDAVENGVNGLRVTAFRLINGSYVEWENVYTGHKPGTPSDDGYFKFCLRPGTYYLWFNTPDKSYNFSVPNQGFNENADSDVVGDFGHGTTASFTVRSGDSVCNFGAGVLPSASVGDRVWYDANVNGIADIGENGIAGVDVMLRNPSGDIVEETTTDANGDYRINVADVGSYYLEFDIPNNYTFTYSNMGDELLDSDVDESNGPGTTPYFNLEEGEHFPNVDAGLMLGVVPVEWSNFTAEHKQTYNDLNWTVEATFDAQYFEIERSIGNNNDFENIGEVLADLSGLSQHNYSFKDYDLKASGEFYYRIKMISNNGTTEYTDIVVVIVPGIEIGTPEFEVYPNPTVFEFTLKSTFKTPVQEFTLEMFNATGQSAKTQVFKDVDSGTMENKIDVRSLTPGMYTVRISVGTEVFNKKLIILNN